MRNRQMFFLSAVLVLGMAAAASADVPQLLNYQGVLKADGEPVTTEVTVLFAIWDAAVDGDSLWSELQAVTPNDDGQFTVQLGAVSPIPDSAFASAEVYLSIKVDPDPEMDPRQRIASAAYAYRAAASDAGDITAVYPDQGLMGGGTSGEVALGIDEIWLSEFVAAADAAYADSTNAITDGGVDFADIGRNGSDANQVIKWNGSAWVAADDEIGGGNGWTDDGTVLRLETHTDSVGIGTVSPTEKLDVTGNIHASGTISSGNSITIDGINDRITASGGTIDFDDENIQTTGDAAFGPGHTNTGAGSFVAGMSNEVSALGTAVGGGSGNTASQKYATVSGGSDNTAGGLSAAVGGGSNNAATGSSAVVAGGSGNFASGGNWKNHFDASHSTIVGGYGDTITSTANHSYLFGIESKLTEDSTFMVDMPYIRFGDEVTGYEVPSQDGATGQVLVSDGAGQLNWSEFPSTDDGDWTISGDDLYSGVPGNVGIGNTAPTEKLDVTGNIHASGTISIGNSITINGFSDKITASGGTINFDDENLVTTGKVTIGPGHTNTSPNGFVAGSSNSAGGTAQTISGGINHTVTGNYSTIGGGYQNNVSTTYGTVGGGSYNSAETSMATVGGGNKNTASGSRATIGGGDNNLVAGDYSAILGGIADTIEATADYSYLFGIDSKLTEDSTFMVDMPHIRFGDEATGYEVPSQDGAIDQILVTDGGGQLNWTDLPSTDDGDWTLTGNVLFTNGEWGIARVGNILYGDYDSTHVNLGAICTTGTDDEIPRKYITISGGRGNAAFVSFSTVGGGLLNRAAGSSSAVGGGWSNQALGNYTTIAGGTGNVAGGWGSAVGGGYKNLARGSSSFIGGGGGYDADSNSALGDNSAILGGAGNLAVGDSSTVGGGTRNTASGTSSSIPGGYLNEAGGDYSLAAGHRAKAMNSGTFVWADGTDADFSSTAQDQFLIRASGGVGIGTTSPAEALDVNGTAKMNGFKLPTGATNGYVLTADGSGNGTWQAAVGGADGDWTLTGDVLFTNDEWGIARAGNILYGDHDSTHVNLGVACTTGTSGSNNKNATVGGGIGNAASGPLSTVSGGQNNKAGNLYATVGGGTINHASGNRSTVGGGDGNIAGDLDATVAGGVFNVASGRISAVGGGGKTMPEESILLLPVAEQRHPPIQIPPSVIIPPFSADAAMSPTGIHPQSAAAVGIRRAGPTPQSPAVF